MTGSPGSWPGRILSGAVGLLLAALALRWAVQIIESIWPTLAICAGVVGLLTLLFRLGHSRSDRW